MVGTHTPSKMMTVQILKTVSVHFSKPEINLVLLKSFINLNLGSTIANGFVALAVSKAEQAHTLIALFFRTHILYRYLIIF